MLKLILKPLAFSSMLALLLAAGMSYAAGGNGIVLKDATEDGSYCHIKYMAFTEASLKSGQLEFDQQNIVDRYGSCDFDPQSPEEVKEQIALMSRGVFGEGSNDSDGGSGD